MFFHNALLHAQNCAEIIDICNTALLRTLTKMEFKLTGLSRVLCLYFIWLESFKELTWKYFSEINDKHIPNQENQNQKYIYLLFLLYLCAVSLCKFDAETSPPSILCMYN